MKRWGGLKVGRWSGTRRNIATLLTGNVLGHGITLLATPVLSRIYGPPAFGALALFLAISAMLGVLASLRYELAIVLPEDDASGASVKRAATVLVMCTSGVVLATTLLALSISGSFFGMPAWSALLGVGMVLSGEASILYYWFTRTKRFRVQGTSRVVQAFSAALVQVVIGWTGSPSAEGLIVGHLTGQAAALLWLLWRDDSRGLSPRMTVDQFRAILVRYRNFPLFNVPNAFVDAFRTNAIYALIGWTSSVHSVGQYSMAMRSVQAPIAVVGASISQVFLQLMASAAPGRLRQLILSLVTRIALVAFIPFVLLGVFAPSILPWLLGERWMEAGVLAQALTPWLYVNLITSPISTVFVVTERQGLLLAFAILYAAAPIAPLCLLGSNLVFAVWVMSAAMTVLLLLFLVLAVHVASHHDRTRQASKE